MERSVRRGIGRIVKKSVSSVKEEAPAKPLDTQNIRKAVYEIERKKALEGMEQRRREKPPAPKAVPEGPSVKDELNKLARTIDEATRSVRAIDIDPERKTRYGAWLAALLAIAVLAAFCAAVLVVSTPKLPVNCTDGTQFGECSVDKPLYCTRDALAPNPVKCGCPAGQRLYREKCIDIIQCYDGTFEPECSTTRPMQCMGGFLEERASLCGCPENEYAVGDSCREVPKCSDGTLEGYCSATKPFYCTGGELVEQPTLCGAAEIDLAIKQRDEAFAHINSLRSEYGRSELAWDGRAYALAIARAKDMYDRNYLDHVTPEGTCAKDLKAQYNFTSNENVAENIWKIYYESGAAIEANPNLAVSSWMTSRPHRYNLLYEQHASGAVGCYHNICMFYGVNAVASGLGAGPCVAWADSSAFWQNAGTQKGEV